HPLNSGLSCGWAPTVPTSAFSPLVRARPEWLLRPSPLPFSISCLPSCSLQVSKSEFRNPNSEIYSMVFPHFLHERTRRPSPSTLFPMRVCFLQFLHTRATFEMWIDASFSTMPPLMLRCGFGRVCRLI